MPHVTANGLSFHVQELGSGTPVVMVHGLLIGSIASWYFTTAPVLARTHRVRMFDLRGHGMSQRAAGGYDVRTLAGDLAALSEDLGPVDVVGHSWGALVAMRFALAHPERVRRLVLVEAPLPPSSVTEIASFLDGDPAELPRRLLDALPETLREMIVQPARSGSRTPLAGGGRQARRFLASVATLALETSLLSDLRAEPDVTDEELATLRAPCLAVYGDRSSCAPAGARLARVVPGLAHLVLAGGHYLHLDARAPLTAAIEAHLG